MTKAQQQLMMLAMAMNVGIDHPKTSMIPRRRREMRTTEELLAEIDKRKAAAEPGNE